MSKSASAWLSFTIALGLVSSPLWLYLLITLAKAFSDQYLTI